jgi:menaquinone-specific isochorismate synthase
VAVEAIREQLAPLAASVTTGERTVRKLATVQHLHTPVRATLGADRHVLDLVDALHPTPAVGGLPPDAALETIRAVEPFDRGWYAAPVGWIDPAGNGTFTVAIRSATIADRRATLFAGAGIVADSDPASEWDEVQLKYRPILDALDG